MARQNHLRNGKFFTCHCPRCTDPTELGTHFSSLKCNKCEPGIITSTDPLSIFCFIIKMTPYLLYFPCMYIVYKDDTAEWKCSHCPFKTSGTAVKKAISCIQAEVDEVLAMKFTAERLQHGEELLRKYRSVLHPLHFIQTDIRQALIEMYGRVEGYTLPELPDVILEHKIDLCQQLMRVLDTVHPGKTRARALLMYELHAPLVQTARSAFQVGLLSGEPLRQKLQKAIDLLKECSAILEWEDPSTVEATVAQLAKDNVDKLELSIVSILP